MLNRIVWELGWGRWRVRLTLTRRRCLFNQVAGAPECGLAA